MKSSRSYKGIWEKAWNSAVVTAWMLIICISAFPQSEKLDSLKALLKEASGNRKAHLLNEVAIRVSNDLALGYYDQIISEATDSVILARAISNKGIILYRMGRMDEASNLLEDAIPLFEKIGGTDYYLESMYVILGKIYMFTGRYSSSLELFYNNLRRVSNWNDSILIGYQLHDLGVLYYKIRDNETALRFYSDALNFVKGDSGVQFLAYMNSSLCLSELGFPRLALAYCDRAFLLANGKERNLLHFEFATGFAQLKLGCVDEAIEMFSRSLIRSVKIGDARMHADNLLYLGKAWFVKSMLDSASHALRQAERLAEANQFSEILLDVYRAAIQIANLRRELPELIAYQQKYIRLRQEVYNIELEQKLAAIEGDWYERQNEQRIDLQQMKIDERRKAITYQQWISVTLYFVVVFILSIIVLYVRGLLLQMQSQRFLEVQVDSRLKRLKRGAVHRREYGVDSVTSEGFELGGRIGLICDQLKGIFDKYPQKLGIDPYKKLFEGVAFTYMNRNDESSVLSSKD